MADGLVSLVIVSRHRVACLLRAVTAARLQDHADLELIVVTDPVAADAVSALGLPIKVVVFDTANIAAARNEGLGVASGAVVAFLDDDAVPEPTWISRLIAPFDTADIPMTTGFVRGRNGISDQWRAVDVDRFGWDHALSVDRMATTFLAGTAARGLKAQGTNCAFRRDALLALGGFDAGFRFYLDDADISLRMAARAGLAAVVPGAVVQHGFAASLRRKADRTPLDLVEIAASMAYFLRRHAPDADMARQRADQRRAQELRLFRHMVDGTLEPRDIDRLLNGFDRGWAEGLLRPLHDLAPINATTSKFLRLGTGLRPGVLLAGKIWQRRNLARQAGVEAAMGKIVTVICLSPTTWYHRHAFVTGGFWIQRGGTFGRSVREGGLIRFQGFAKRVRAEGVRIGQTRPIS